MTANPSVWQDPVVLDDLAAIWRRALARRQERLEREAAERQDRAS